MALPQVAREAGPAPVVEVPLPLVSARISEDTVPMHLIVHPVALHA